MGKEIRGKELTRIRKPRIGMEKKVKREGRRRQIY